MARLWLMIILIGCVLTSGCQKKQEKRAEEEFADATTITETLAPTTTANLKPSIMAMLTPAPTAAETFIPNRLFTFEVQPITVQEDMDTPYMTKEEFPVLDGSTANIPLGEAIYCYLTGASLQEAKSELKFHKTSDSYRRLMKKEADILFVYEPSQKILEEMKEQYAEFDFKPLGRDALVFIANETNPISALTQQEITEIYTGKITKWSDLGGKEDEIMAFQRPPTSGSQTLMEKLAVPATMIMNGPQVVKPTQMGELIDVLASYNNASNAIGYSVYFYANYMYSKPGLKFMAIDGVLPTNETIQTGAYPYVNDFYVVIRKDEPTDSKARILYHYMTTKEAQNILTKAGYVPVVDVNIEHPSVIKSVEIRDVLNLKQGNYIVDHNVSSKGAFEGDRILTHDYQEIITFPSKYIECTEQLVLDSDVVLLKSYQTVSMGDHDYTSYCYELYNITTKAYVTEHAYDYVKRTLEGYYFTSCYYEGEVEEVIFSSEGELICKVNSVVSNLAFLDVVKDRVACVQGNVLTLYEKDGKIYKEVTLPYDGAEKAYINSHYNYSNEDYLWLRVNGLYLVIYDADGNPVDDQKFLKNVDPSPVTSKPWITNGIVGTDGHLYIVAEIDQKQYLLRDDGTVLYESEMKESSSYLSLNAHAFTIYDPSGSVYHMTLDGEILNPGGEILPLTNDSIILPEDDHFTVYPLYSDHVYVVEDTTYWMDGFHYEEAKTSPYLTTYSAIKASLEVEKASFLGLRTINGYATITKVGDYFILFHTLADSEDEYYELIDYKGNTIYAAEANVEIKGVYMGDEIYVGVISGNYEEIQKLDGTVVYREISNDLADD